MGLFSSLRGRAATLALLLGRLRAPGRRWMIPLLAALVLLAGLMLFAISQSPIAPLIYTVF